MQLETPDSALAPTAADVPLVWIPEEGDTVAVLDYPSPLPLGIVETIERDASGTATTYWIWLLDGCRIALEATTVAERLGRPYSPPHATRPLLTR